MANSLFETTVSNYLRTLKSMRNVFQKGLDHCEQSGLNPDSLITERIFEDMFPLGKQAISIHHHSAGAIEGALAGKFAPPQEQDPTDYQAAQAKIDHAIVKLEEVSEETVNTIIGKDVVFEVGDRKLPFTGENFLLTFSMPNFYFHATTAYNILRMKGVPIGKIDFLGPLVLNKD